MSERKIEITTPLILAYLDVLAEIGVYGETAGRVANFILRKEIMHLIETDILDPIPVKLLAPKAKMFKAEEQDEADSEP